MMTYKRLPGWLYLMTLLLLVGISGCKETPKQADTSRYAHGERFRLDDTVGHEIRSVNQNPPFAEQPTEELDSIHYQSVLVNGTLPLYTTTVEIYEAFGNPKEIKHVGLEDEGCGYHFNGELDIGYWPTVEVELKGKEAIISSVLFNSNTTVFLVTDKGTLRPGMTLQEVKKFYLIQILQMLRMRTRIKFNWCLLPGKVQKQMAELFWFLKMEN